MSTDDTASDPVWPAFVTFVVTLVSAIVLALTQVVSMPTWLVIGYRVARSTGAGFWRSLGRSLRSALGVLFDFSF